MPKEEELPVGLEVPGRDGGSRRSLPRARGRRQGRGGRGAAGRDGPLLGQTRSARDREWPPTATANGRVRVFHSEGGVFCREAVVVVGWMHLRRGLSP